MKQKLLFIYYHLIQGKKLFGQPNTWPTYVAKEPLEASLIPANRTIPIGHSIWFGSAATSTDIAIPGCEEFTPGARFVPECRRLIIDYLSRTVRSVGPTRCNPRSVRPPTIGVTIHGRVLYLANGNHFRSCPLCSLSRSCYRFMCARVSAPTACLVVENCPFGTVVNRDRWEPLLDCAPFASSVKRPRFSISNNRRIRESACVCSSVFQLAESVLHSNESLLHVID